MTPIEWTITAVFGVFAGFAINYATGGKVESEGTQKDPATSALERLAEHGDAELRPYLGVSGVKSTMKIGQPVSVVIQFTNSGKTPAGEGFDLL